MYYYTRAFQNYFNFSGRDSRKQFWMFMLINFIICILLQILSVLLGDLGLIIMGLYELIIFIPGLAMVIRRLHDVNKSGFWIFINFVPIIGTIWYFILLIRKGDPVENRFGSVPTK